MAISVYMTRLQAIKLQNISEIHLLSIQWQNLGYRKIQIELRNIISRVILMALAIPRPGRNHIIFAAILSSNY